MPAADPDDGSPGAVYRFGAFELDTARGALRRGGAEVHLRPKSYEVLRYLAAHPGRVVSKDELLDAVWSPTIVTEGALTQCLVDLRRVLGDDAHQVIRTLHRRGVRFDAPVSVDTPVASPANAPNSDSGVPRTRWRPHSVVVALLLGTAALGWWTWRAPQPTTDSATDVPYFLSAPPPVVIDSFDAVGDEPSLERTALSIRSALRTRLAGMRSIAVIDLNPGTPPPSAYRLNGSVSRQDGAVALELRLFAPESAQLLWTETLVRDDDDAEFPSFRLQPLLIDGVVQAHRIVRAIPASVAGDAAKAEFFHGQVEWQRYLLGAGGNPDIAGDHWRRAIRLAPRFWGAHSQLVSHYANRLELRSDLDGFLMEAHQAARGLMALAQHNDRLAFPVQWHLTVALLILHVELDYTYAERLILMAKENGWPAGEMDYELGKVRFARGDLEGAERHLRAALHRGAQGLHPLAHALLGSVLTAQGRYDEAEEVFERGLQHTVPGSWVYLILQVRRIEAMHFGDRTDEAAALLQSEWAAFGDRTPEVFAHVLALLGRRDEALVLLSRAPALFEEGRLASSWPAFQAWYHLHDWDEAFVWLDRVIERREWSTLGHLHHAPHLDPLRHDERFAAAMSRLREIEQFGSALRPDIDATLTQDSATRSL
jgi:DNA-binding winged helix-turn-helix (wHTH) protein/tetratricopeptide (TPR) repeat protein/TolB-like protein